MAKRAVVIGAGIGGLSAALRLRALGLDVTVLERNAVPGGRAMVRAVDGYTFDMGPTVLTVPHFIEELFALRPGEPGLSGPDFPPAVLADGVRVTSGVSGGPETSRYVELRPIVPFYRIWFDDGTWFDYDGDPASTRAQIAKLAPDDLPGYERFHADAKAIFERGFLELGYTHFGDVWSMLRVAPDLLRLDAVRSLFSFTSRYFASDKLRRVFSFETLLVGGNPLSVPAIYAMIHFVEKTWGIHYAMGGTGALVRGLVRKLGELGGALEVGATVASIRVAGGRATGVALADGRVLDADVVVSNADYAHTHLALLQGVPRRWNADWVVKARRYSMSLVVVYFGFEAPPEPLELQHHNVILGKRYEGLLDDIFSRKVLSEDVSQYLHLPTLTDPSLAPPGHHAAYTLVPVPHQGANVDWASICPGFVDRVLAQLEERHLPGLRGRLRHLSYITPDHFSDALLAHLGNAFGPEPTLLQSAWFRPHNRSQDVSGLYLVGAGAQPGAGTPSVMMSAKMTARLVAEDLGLRG